MQFTNYNIFISDELSTWINQSQDLMLRSTVSVSKLRGIRKTERERERDGETDRETESD